MGNELIKEKFDDIDKKIDFMMERCRTLQMENEALLLKVENLETKLKKKDDTGKEILEEEALIQSKIDRLLDKLNLFSNDAEVVCSSDR